MSEFVCIKCPLSCRLSVERQNDEIIVTGNNCSKGREFGKQEYLAPKRVVTSLVKIINGDKPVLPVKTSAPVPKEDVKKVLDIISKLEVQAPVNIGDIVYKNIYDGADLVATSYTRRLNASEN
ncbi:MAG TPA: DUF1667 domain-containing protein [Clostridia bacterium]